MPLRSVTAWPRRFCALVGAFVVFDAKGWMAQHKVSGFAHFLAILPTVGCTVADSDSFESQHVFLSLGQLMMQRQACD